MLSKWLNYNVRTPQTYTKFNVEDFGEQKPFEKKINDYLSSAFLDTIIDPHDYEDFVKDLGWETAKEFFIDTKIPTYTKVRRGLFGEILISLILEEFLKYHVPVKKSHYSIAQNKSQEGIDILGFMIESNRIQEVCFVESKLRTKYDGSVAVNGYQELTKQHAAKMPTILPFVLRQLKKTNHTLHKPFLDYLKKRTVGRRDDTLRLGIITEKEDWNENALTVLENDLSRPDNDITVNLILIKELKTIIENVYSKIGVNYE